ncbi:LysR family transcriptional regulator [Rhizohabitans arisaemae]|uniref:LysR family transcriptional regulator n=1 Tax=Rhizohabitans arisaemae TaxID=2720610 RepID=UPI0024B08AE9|nr:LysR family transcriptional regulator [Rhizohabitans arisaemae]
MDLKQLTALITVAEVGSITKAARLLHLVQPAVTRQIRLLEEEMGVRLFERTRHGMVPTAAGEVLIERSRRALHELERARAEIRPEPRVVTGIVTVGVLESVIDLLVEPLVRDVTERHPGIELRIVTAYSGHLQQWLDAGDVDLSLLYNLADTPSLAVVPLLEERLWAVAPPHAGLTFEEPMAWEELLARPLVLPAPGHGLRILIDQARSSLEIEPRIAVQANSMYLQKMLVLGGHGWTVLPAVGVAREVSQGVLSGAPLTGPDTSRSLVLGLQRGTRTPPPVEAVATEIVRLVRALVNSGAWPSARLSGGIEKPHVGD